MATASLAFGASVEFPTTNVIDAEVLGFSWTGGEHAVVDISHLGSTNWRTFLHQDLADPGEVSLDLHLDTGSLSTTTTELIGMLIGATAALTINFPLVGSESTQAAWSANAGITGASFTGALDDKITATLTLKLLGAISATNAA